MLDLEFMRLALASAAVVGLLAPAVGFFLVQRQLSLVGDGIGHVAFAGVAAGLLLDVSPVLAALVAAVLGAVALEWLRSRRHAVGDRALALVFYTGIAGGVVLVSMADALNVDLFAYLFGSVLTVTRGDFAVVAGLGVVALATVLALYRPFAAVTLDVEGARVLGAPVGALNLLLSVLAAITIAVSMRIVGLLLVAALMVLPVIAALRVASSLLAALAVSLAIGLVAALGGVSVAYYADLPPGGSIVLLAACGYVLAASAARIRGV